jgi:uncharacterized membrane protein
MFNLNLFKQNAAYSFSKQDKALIVTAINKAELKTSGEIRVYIESKCKTSDALDRVKALFDKLEIAKTKDRNGVLVYVAIKTKKLAIYGDVGIYEQVGKDFWEKKVEKMIHYFNKADYVVGISSVVEEVGEALSTFFPYNYQSDTNELPNDIVFGN